MPTIEQLLEIQNQRWELSQPTFVESLLREFSIDFSELKSDEILNMLCNEIRWRESAGEKPQLSEYQTRFPNLANELPDNWQIKTIADVIDGLKYGTSVKCSPEKIGCAVLRIPNVVSGLIDVSDLKYGDLNKAERDSLALKAGDILLIRSNGSVKLVGRTALVTSEHEGLAYAGYLIRLRPKLEMISPEYLNLLFTSTEIRDQIEIPARSTSGVNNINSEEVRALTLPLPPLDEQLEIVRLVGALLVQIGMMNYRMDVSNKLCERLIGSILSKAFSGSLVSQDSTDESVLALLERIDASTHQNNGKSKVKTEKTSKIKVTKTSTELAVSN